MRLLVISYFFAPQPTPGALRVGALVKWLPAEGWEVDLVTTAAPFVPRATGESLTVAHKPWIDRLREDFGVRPDIWFKAPPPETWTPGAVEPPGGVAGRAYGVFRRTILQASTWPDRAYGWSRQVRRPLAELIARRPPDVVLSSSPPQAAHFIGRWVRARTSARWIADLRDPWSDTHHMAHAAWRRKVDRATEKHVLSRADLLTTVSEPIAENLQRLHPGKRIVTILNGFDPDLFPGPVPSEPGPFTVTYTGSVVLGKNDVITFLEGARRFHSGRGSAATFRIRFLGETSPALREQIGRFGLEAITSCEPRSEHAAAVEVMRRSAVNLFLPWQDPDHPGVYSGKLFEYLGARRPILAVGPVSGLAGALVESTGAGRIARTADEVVARLTELLEAHATGRTAWHASESEVLRYSHREMVRSFANELRRLGNDGARLRGG